MSKNQFAQYVDAQYHCVTGKHLTPEAQSVLSCLMQALIACIPCYLDALMACITEAADGPEHYRPGDRPRC